MSFVKSYSQFTRFLFEKIVDTLVKIFGIIMALTILFQILNRYLMPSVPAPWTDEISRYAFMWFCFLGSAYAMYKDVHFSVDFLAKKFPVKGRRILAIFSRILTVFFALLLVIYGIQLMRVIGAMKSSYLRWPMSVFYVILPVTGVLYILDSLDWFMSEKRRHCVD